MKLWLPIVALGLAMGAGAAWADAGRAAAPQQAADVRPVKDCTRHNGRVGYYGNPWCTPAEQARWDRWEARRVRAGR